MTMRYAVWQGAAVLWAMAASASAAPLELSRVAADAKWLMHVDFDAMRETLLAKKMKEHPKHAAHMAMVQAMIGMNPEQDLHGATMYGSKLGEEQGVMILDARMDQKRVGDMLRKASSPKEGAYGERKYMEMEHKPRHRSEPMRLAVAFLEGNLIVAASSVDDLKSALDVIDGKAASLTTSSSLAGAVPPGTTMLMRVEGIRDAAGKRDCCKLAKQAESFRFVTGENEGQAFYRARAEMTNPKVAAQLQEVVEGMRALGQLHVGDNEVGLRLVNDLRVKTDGGELTVLWKGSAEEVWAIVEAHKKIFAEKKAKYAAMKKHRGDKKHDGDAPAKSSPSGGEEDF